MERVAIRENVFTGFSSAVTLASGDGEDIGELIERLGKDKVIKKVFGDQKLSYQDLADEYVEFIKGKKSALFSWMYIVDCRFGVVIDEHIYLCRYENSALDWQKQLCPWIYVKGKRYIGDPWWSEDEEILADIKKLNILDFAEKYKGF